MPSARKGRAAADSATGSILVPFPLNRRFPASSGRHSGAASLVPPHIPAPVLNGKRLLLHFGAVDWRAEVWVNGEAVGEHRRRLRSFHFRHHRRAESQAPAQEIVVAVWDPTDTGLQPRGKQVLDPNSIWYTAVSGIWQTVWLEPVPAALIAELAHVPTWMATGCA